MGYGYDMYINRNLGSTELGTQSVRQDFLSGIAALDSTKVGEEIGAKLEKKKKVGWDYLAEKYNVFPLVPALTLVVRPGQI